MQTLSDRLIVAIPTMNNTLTLNAAIESVAMQEIPQLKVLIYDNGSIDGTPEMIKKQIENKWWRYIDLGIMETTEKSGGRVLNIPYMRYRLALATDKEYIFYLDSDVRLPPNCLEEIVREFEARRYIGMMGIRYEPLHDHVTMGATLMKTEIAKKIKWTITEQCECLNCIKELQALGLSSEYHPHLIARHIKYL